MWNVSNQFRQRAVRTPNVESNTDSDLIPNGSTNVNVVVNDLAAAPPPKPLSKNEKLVERSRTYWTRNFFVVLLPFIACGLPLHVIIKSRKREGKSKAELDENSWVYWFEFRFQTKISSALTLLMLPWWLFGNLYWGSFLIRIAYDLVIKGRLTEKHYEYLFTLLYMFPIVLTMDYAWVYGHSLNTLIKTFGEPVKISCPPSNSSGSPRRILSINDDPRRDWSSESSIVSDVDDNDVFSNESISEATQLSSEPTRKDVLSIETDLKVSNFRTELVKVYLVVGVIYVLHFFVTGHRARVEGWNAEKVRDHWIHYLYTIAYTLMLPVYHCFCGALLCKLHSLSRYIERMIDTGVKMELSHVYLIKKAYKVIADSIVHLNAIFRVFLGMLLVVLYFTASYTAGDVLIFVFQRIWTYFSGNPLSLVNSANNETLFSTTNLIRPAVSTDEDLGVPPDVVRFYVGMAFESILLIYLMRSTIWEAIHVNDEARYLQVRLNDLATELASCSGKNHVVDRYHANIGKTYYVDSDVYRAFKLLKLYVHSRMEAHATKQRALLDVLPIIMILPGMPLRNRLAGYALIH